MSAVKGVKNRKGKHQKTFKNQCSELYMDPNTTAAEETFHKQVDDNIFIPTIETAETSHVRELLKQCHAFSQDDLDNALITACQYGHRYLIQTLVNLGANLQKNDSNGNTPLLICAQNGFANICRFLIKRKADINTTNSFGDTALILCINPAGSIEMVKLLLQHREINVNHQNKDGYTALMKAVEAMDIDVIRLLLDALENTENMLVLTKNCRNETAQDIADKLSIGDIVRLLAKHRKRVTDVILAVIQACDLDSFYTLIDCQFSDAKEKELIIQNTCIKVFETHKINNQTFNESEVEMLKIMLKYGASMSHKYFNYDPMLVATVVGSYSVLELLCEHVASCSLYCCSNYDNLLKIAAENGRTDLIELLLKYKASINGFHFINSALDRALRHGHINCAKFLMKHGATMDLKEALKSAVINSCPLYLKYLTENFKDEVRSFASAEVISNLLVSAAAGGNLEIIGLILDAGANVNYTNTRGETPLMEAKNAEVVHFLVKKGAIVNRRCKRKSKSGSVLTYILSNRLSNNFDEIVGIIRALLENGAYINGKSSGGRTPLMTAASKTGCKNILRMLLKYGADVRMRDVNGNTALIIASQANLTDNLACLLQYAKNIHSIINVQNLKGLTALMVSTERQNLQALKELIKHGANLNIEDFKGNTALLHTLKNFSEIKNEILTALISAGSDVNYQNNDGFSPLMLAAKNSLKDALALLVNSGADVNAVSKHSSIGTALTVLSKNSGLGDNTQACMEYLLDQGAKASYIKPTFFHRLIQLGKVHFIPKLIQCGFGPIDIKPNEIPQYAFISRIVSTVSPLCMAWLTANTSLARYFFENTFLTSSDLSSLTATRGIRRVLFGNTHQECLDLLDEKSRQVMSLFKLAFVATQTVVGTTPGREERVSMLPLPKAIKDKLLFKTENIHLDITSATISPEVTVDRVYTDYSQYGSRWNYSYDYYDYSD